MYKGVNKMICNGEFVFKSIKRREAGSFLVNDKTVDYPAAYILQVDERLDNGDIKERKFKIDIVKTLLFNRLKDCEPYDDIVLNFEVSIYDKGCGLEIIDFSKVTE